MTFGVRHTVAVESNVGPVRFVYEVNPSKRTFAFRGVERLNGTENLNEDIPPGVVSLGPTAVSSAVWKRVYNDDKARRDHFK